MTAKVFTSLLAATLITLPLAAGPLTDTERQRLLDHLERTREAFLESVDGLTEQQWTYREAEDRWSITECADHIAVSEQFIRAAAEGAIESGTTAEGVEPKEDMVLEFVVDRSQKFQAPEPIQPSGHSPGDAMKMFKDERTKTEKLAREGGDLRAHAAEHPAFGNLDVYAWLLFLSGHTERHTLQIEEVKASPGFPKS